MSDPKKCVSPLKSYSHEKYGYFLKNNVILFNSTPAISNCFSLEGSNLLGSTVTIFHNHWSLPGYGGSKSPLINLRE